MTRPNSRPPPSNASSTKIRIGCVPEHFSCPIYLAAEKNENLEVIHCGGGTGEMIRMLEDNEIDLAIALTEGLIANLTNKLSKKKVTNTSTFKIVGTYVSQPLTWSIAVHPSKRPNLSAAEDSVVQNEDEEKTSIPDSALVINEGAEKYSSMKGMIVGISRFGSGSHIIPFVIAEKMGWLKKKDGTVPFIFKVLNDIVGLRKGIVESDVDCFLWERFTTKPYYDSGELYHLTNITPEWPAFMFAASQTTFNSPDSQIYLQNILGELTLSAKEFIANYDYENGANSKSKSYVMDRFGYPAEDVQKWFETVAYPDQMNMVDFTVVERCVSILRQSGVIENCKIGLNEIIDKVFDIQSTRKI